ncbi:MAG: PDZ domain-containing protein [Planctomycetes bacterium]|nr:PDZ domain-containing protein [Planctomycetota bacterium]
MSERQVSWVQTLVFSAGLAVGGQVWAADDAGHSPDAAMLRYPAASSSQVAFVYANNLWVAPRAGGLASPVAAPPGTTAFPRFSPDGKSLAFIGSYDNNRDLYTIGVGGGIPFRVTHHPGGETLCHWTEDGKLLFLTNSFAGLGRQSQLFSVPAAGGMPEKLPMPYAGFGSVNHDGSMVAFTPHSTDTRTWKRYRGGMATDIWVMNLKDKSSKKITDWEGTDSLPMWGKGKNTGTVYYVCDAGSEHRLNIWSYDTASGTRKQVTTFAEDDVKWPSMGPGANGNGEIVFQLGSKLMLLDVESGKSTAVKVTIPGAKPSVAPRAIDASRNVSAASISPTGKRVVLSARGDIWTAPAKEGPARNMTRTDGAFDRDPSWSPDGKWIAYFSDQDGEYDLWVRPADARSAEDAKKDDEEKDEPKKDDAKGDEAKKEEAKKEEPKPAVKFEATRLTNFKDGFRYDPQWSPDSSMVAFTDKAGMLQVAVLKIEDGKVSAEIKDVDQDPGANRMAMSWSHDNAWIAYSKNHADTSLGAIFIYNVKTGEKKQVTGDLFAASSPAFDRKGDYLYFSTNRNFSSPRYADLDTTFAYVSTEVLMAVPLRDGMKHPYAVKSDEEEYKKDEPKKDDKKEEKKDEKKDEKAGEKKPEGDKPAEKAAKPDDGVSGVWDCSTVTPNGPMPFKLKLALEDGGKVSVTIISMMGTTTTSGTFDKASGKFSVTLVMGQTTVVVEGTISGESMSGTWGAGESKGDFSGKRTSTGASDDKKDDAKADGKKDDKKKDEKKPVKIDFDGFERRAFQLPVAAGNFGRLAVSHDNKLIYARTGTVGDSGGGNGIKIFDLNDDSREERAVTAGGGFDISGDGKKLLVGRGGSWTICDASAGGGKSQNVTVSGLRATIDPKDEWKQVITDTWRLHRDFFYEPTMHGVDWAKVRDHYLAMVDDCSNREDVAYLQAEMVSELNIGHAYISSPGDVAPGAGSVPVGLLGCDYEFDATNKAYKITRIIEGGPWDLDGKGPLSEPGVKSRRVNVGDYVLAVNGIPVDTNKDIFASFIGTADKPTLITVSTKPTMDDAAREVLVKPIGNEGTLRYRAWIEKNRKYVEEQSGGTVGYIYVPNTGVDGQNDLFRQFFGQRGKAGLIIDERWNGGGQIPTRFIELLNRPATNYWAKRDGVDWTWPPDSHQGHKVMLVNGLAGSGGDMFPWLFKHNKIGKVFGMRTWGGLVGISGNPGLIDGGVITVPTFGFYERDGTWGVEGHGTDPDVEVIDDPSKMVNGGDPQLDAALTYIKEQIATNPYKKPARPASPNRSGMGINPADK